MEPDSPPLQTSGGKTSALAIWSLVLGCLGVALLIGCVGIVFAVPAVICGHMAHSRIKRSGGTLAGGGMALAGLITGYVSIGLSLVIIPMMMAIALPNFVKARSTAQNNICINNLRTIDGAKQTYALDKKLSLEDTPTAEDLAPYLKQPFNAMRCPAGGAYSINKIGEPPTCSIANHRLPPNR